MEENNNNINNNEQDQEQKQIELSPEIKAVLEKDAENRKKLAEVFAQCWDDEAFKKRFMEHPEEVMTEYGVIYDKSKDYVVMDTKDKVVTCVLPYENIKDTMLAIGDAFKKAAESGPDTRKVLPEGWSMEFIQNTADTNYLVIPLNPEKLTPEELEMINGGFVLITPGVFLVVFAAVAVVVAATAAVAINVAVAANAAIAANIALGLNVAINVNVAANINVAGWDNENIFKAYGKFFGSNGKTY